MLPIFAEIRHLLVIHLWLSPCCATHQAASLSQYVPAIHRLILHCDGTKGVERADIKFIQFSLQTHFVDISELTFYPISLSILTAISPGEPGLAGVY